MLTTHSRAHVSGLVAIFGSALELLPLPSVLVLAILPSRARRFIPCIPFSLTCPPGRTLFPRVSTGCTTRAQGFEVENNRDDDHFLSPTLGISTICFPLPLVLGTSSISVDTTDLLVYSRPLCTLETWHESYTAPPSSSS